MHTSKIRKPAVAGSFYTDNPKELKNEVKKYLKNTKAQKSGTMAVISPHAGYVFSGQTAAEAINQINPDKKYDNVFVLAVSHHKAMEGASVFTGEKYIMPGFELEVNTEIANNLIEKCNYFKYDEFAHLQEHSLEVQLPFIYYHLKKDFKIVPVLIGTTNKKAIKDISESLKPYFNDKNVFVISSDFSHFPAYDEAKKNDKLTAEAILSNNSQIFTDVLKKNMQKRIPGLSTSACGWASILTLLYLTEKNKNYKYEIIDYKNSGDSIFGEKNNVVGYYAISLRKKNNFNLTNKEKEKLLKISRKTLDSFIKNNTYEKIDASEISENLKKNLGAFVTLRKKGKLRGCIGRFMPNQPLYKVIEEMTIAASTQDNRFSPVSKEELEDINIEISVLTPLQKVNSIDEIQVGRDGIYVKKDFRSGTLLPQVAIDNNWDNYEFVKYCSKYKAGLGENEWKDADIFVYQAIVFEE